MNSISGAEAAGVHVGVRTQLVGIHHPDQVSSAAPACSALSRSPQMLLAYGPVRPKARLHADARILKYTHTHTCSRRGRESILQKHKHLHTPKHIIILCLRAKCQTKVKLSHGRRPLMFHWSKRSQLKTGIVIQLFSFSFLCSFVYWCRWVFDVRQSYQRLAHTFYTICLNQQAA